MENPIKMDDLGVPLFSVIVGISHCCVGGGVVLLA